MVQKEDASEHAALGDAHHLVDVMHAEREDRAAERDGRKPLRDGTRAHLRNGCCDFPTGMCQYAGEQPSHSIFCSLYHDPSS